MTTLRFMDEQLSLPEAIRARVEEASPRLWEVEDFADLGSGPALWQALARLAKAGELRRVRKGLYWRGDRVAAFPSLGMSPPPGEQLARHAAGVDAGYGLAGPSAANALGLSTQVPRQQWWAIPRRPPSGMPDSVRFVDRSSAPGRVAHALRPIEVAVLEVLAHPEWVEGNRGRIEARIRELASQGRVDVERLRAASETEPSRVQRALALAA